MTPFATEKITVSKLRAMNAQALKELRYTLLIEAKGECMAVLVPYEQYMEVQKLILVANKLASEFTGLPELSL
jgi:hypothetical protein